MKYTFEGQTFQTKITTPDNVDAYNAEFARLTAVEFSDRSTYWLLHSLMPFYLEPALDADGIEGDFEKVGYGSFDIKTAREAAADFLVDGVTIYRTLIGS